MGWFTSQIVTEPLKHRLHKLRKPDTLKPTSGCKNWALYSNKSEEKGSTTITPQPTSAQMLLRSF